MRFEDTSTGNSGGVFGLRINYEPVDKKPEKEYKGPASQRPRKCYVCGNYEQPDYSCFHPDLVNKGKHPSDQPLRLRKCCKKCGSDLPDFWIFIKVGDWIRKLRKDGVYCGAVPLEEDLLDSQRKTFNKKGLE